MTAIEALEVLMVSLCTVLVALGLAASALNVLLTRFFWNGSGELPPAD
jgi:hypothetical protein